MKTKAPALSTVVATIAKVTPRHARRLIENGDPRVGRSLDIAGRHESRVIAEFIQYLHSTWVRDDVPMARLNLNLALCDGTIKGRLKRRVQNAFDRLVEAETVYDRALAEWDAIDRDTAGTGLLADVAATVRELDAENQQPTKGAQAK